MRLGLGVWSSLFLILCLPWSNEPKDQPLPCTCSHVAREWDASHPTTSLSGSPGLHLQAWIGFGVWGSYTMPSSGDHICHLQRSLCLSVCLCLPSDYTDHGSGGSPALGVAQLAQTLLYEPFWGNVCSTLSYLLPESLSGATEKVPFHLVIHTLSQPCV